MRTIFALAILALSSSTLAVPPHHYSGGGVNSPYPKHTNVSYYAIGGWPVADTMCLDQVGNGTIKASVCTPLKYPSIAVWEVPHNNCTLTVYEGSKTCGWNATKEIHKVQKGNSLICASTGAATQDVSVVWACR